MTAGPTNYAAVRNPAKEASVLAGLEKMNRQAPDLADVFLRDAATGTLRRVKRARGTAAALGEADVAPPTLGGL